MTGTDKGSGLTSRKVFLCHSSGDKEAVRKLYRTLRAAGADPWLDEEDLIGGQDWDTEIPKALRNSAIVVVCLSTNSVAKTGYVQREVKFALDAADLQPEGQIFIIPVRLDECVVPERLSKWHRVDLFKADGESKLLKALNSRGLVEHGRTQDSKLRLTVYRAYFQSLRVECFFIQATNITVQEDLEITHLWLETNPPFHFLEDDRPVSKRLKAQETWETWVRVDDLGSLAEQDVFHLARARLSTGVIISSIKNEGVPPFSPAPGGPISRRLDDKHSESDMVGYFSMEIAILPSMPTYCGGLGVFAGDTLRSAADRGLSLVGVTLVHRKGYFRQMLGADGTQTAVEQTWSPEEILAEETARVSLTIEGRRVTVRAWRYDMEGVTGKVIPIYMLDTDLPENDARDRLLTDHLYGGDSDYRLCQEAVLGIGGALMLEALGHTPVVYHINEGHPALLTVALMEMQVAGAPLTKITDADVNAIRRHCVFTTHTPVPTGHDRFSMEQAKRILGEDCAAVLERLDCCHENLLNMTYIALRFSWFVNGVAMQHGIVSRLMFPEHKIEAITNGVHAVTWAAPSFQQIFDQTLPGWRTENFALRYAIDISVEEIASAHMAAKEALFDEVAKRTGVALSPKVFTIGFARRMAAYTRPDLLFSQPKRIVELAEEFGGLQILYAGNAHPADDVGKALIRRVVEMSKGLNSANLRIIYMEDYDWNLAALLVSGVDLWLSNPQRPYEASGTSGMKAALNGVPSLGVLDGWWIEGCIEGVTGWAIPDFDKEAQESASIYQHLENTILPMYYQQPQSWHEVMRSTIALNGSFFNTQRMLGQYMVKAYFPQGHVYRTADTLGPASRR